LRHDGDRYACYTAAIAREEDAEYMVYRRTVAIQRGALLAGGDEDRSGRECALVGIVGLCEYADRVREVWRSGGEVAGSEVIAYYTGYLRE
jgi:cyanophycinase-like exopeptidase